MADLLIELFSEEIPARLQRNAGEGFKTALGDGLKKANLSSETAAVYWTPRRLTVHLTGLATKQPDLREEKKGPKVGAPEKAVEGFLRSAGLDSLDQCEQRETPKGAVWFAVVEKKGGETTDVLPGLIDQAIRAVAWPTSMRFADRQFRWSRPLQRIMVLFDGAPLSGTFDLGGGAIEFCAHSTGHRFLAPSAFDVTGFEDYAANLSAGKVVLDPTARKQAIADGLASKATAEKLTVKDDPGLLDEVTNLVEWPTVLIGKIDEEFMDVPPEVLTTSMRTHQKYFSLLQADGSLAPRFAVVANIEAVDGGARIVSGNERVLRARLADAKFFWDQDRATALEDRLTALEAVIFHAKLGTVAQRVDRITNLANLLCEYIPDADVNDARRAARLAKADLTTEMVGEIPELQGLMGRYYALHQGESDAVADAIAAHYAPAGPSDACPTAPVSVAVALAEKLDTLIGFWLIDEKPTGSRDPFALRRAALGVIRLALENDLRLPLTKVFGKAAALYAEQDAVTVTIQELGGITSDLVRFIADRLRVHLKDEGVSHDLVEALFALGTEDDPVRLVARVHALRDFVGSEDGANLLTAYRRAANILRAEEKKDGTAITGAVDPALFAQGEETALSGALETVEGGVHAGVEAEDYAGAMGALAALRGPVDAFFDEVTVNADEADLRANRLRLLARIRVVMEGVADFSHVEKA